MHQLACGHGMMVDCCKEHSTSKEHLEAKKKILEEKLKMIIEVLAKNIYLLFFILIHNPPSITGLCIKKYYGLSDI